jgi:hypothetical protein
MSKKEVTYLRPVTRDGKVILEDQAKRSKASIKEIYLEDDSRNLDEPDTYGDRLYNPKNNTFARIGDFNFKEFKKVVKLFPEPLNIISGISYKHFVTLLAVNLLEHDIPIIRGQYLITTDGQYFTNVTGLNRQFDNALEVCYIKPEAKNYTAKNISFPFHRIDRYHLDDRFLSESFTLTHITDASFGSFYSKIIYSSTARAIASYMSNKNAYQALKEFIIY